jgi:hypothetical protein
VLAVSSIIAQRVSICAKAAGRCFQTLLNFYFFCCVPTEARFRDPLLAHFLEISKDKGCIASKEHHFKRESFKQLVDHQSKFYGDMLVYRQHRIILPSDMILQGLLACEAEIHRPETQAKDSAPVVSANMKTMNSLRPTELQRELLSRRNPTSYCSSCLVWCMKRPSSDKLLVGGSRNVWWHKHSPHE